jgi:hypothetical protein
MSTSTATGDCVQQLADEFARLIRDCIPFGQLRTMLHRNEFNPPGVCASHDFCNANEAMGVAFRLVLGRAPDPTSEADTLLWSEAWACARRHHFPRRMELIESAEGTPVYAYTIRDMAIHDPRLSECGRFTVDPFTNYGLTPSEVAALEAANARLQAQHGTEAPEEKQ